MKDEKENDEKGNREVNHDEDQRRIEIFTVFAKKGIDIIGSLNRRKRPTDAVNMIHSTFTLRKTMTGLLFLIILFLVLLSK